MLKNHAPKSLFVVLIAILCFKAAICQEKNDSIHAFSLKEAQQYAIDNNYKIQNAKMDVSIANKRVWQTTAIGLPQVNGSVKFQEFIDIPTQLMPDFLSPAIQGVLLQKGLITPAQLTPPTDTKFPVQFGSKYNGSGDITATQLVFDGSYIVGLQAAKTFVDLSKNSLVKSEIEVKESVAQAYYLVLVAEENLAILDSSLVVLKKSWNDTKEYYKNGFVEQSDVDQLELMYTNLNNKRQLVSRQIEIAYNLLKFQMGMPLTHKLTLTEKLNDFVVNVLSESLIDKPFDYNKNIDFKLMQTQEHLSLLNLRKDKFAYMPSMAAFFTHQRSAQRSEFNFLESDQDWYKSTILGVSLSVPIWSSGMRHAKIQQSKLELKKSQVLKQQVQEALNLDLQNANSAVKTYTEQYQFEVKNMELAKRIYNKTLIKYKEGVASSMELNQAQNQYLLTQGNYFNTVLELLNAQSKLRKVLQNY